MQQTNGGQNWANGNEKNWKGSEKKMTQPGVSNWNLSNFIIW